MIKEQPAASAEPAVLLLRALAWICSDDDRAARLLALTGLDGAALRHGAGDPAVLAAVGGFLADHEPDLTACAAAIECTPAALAAAVHALDAPDVPAHAMDAD